MVKQEGLIVAGAVLMTLINLLWKGDEGPKIFIQKQMKTAWSIHTSKDATNAARNQLCNREEIRHGQWVQLTMDHAPYKPANDFNKSGICYKYGQELVDKPNWVTWDWHPFNSTINAKEDHARTGSDRDGCIFSPWSKTDFCLMASQIRLHQTGRAYKNETVLAIVGDSLSWEHYSSLVMLMGLPSRETDAHRSSRLNRNHIQMACNNTWQLVYRRSDYLEFLPHVIESTAPNVLVINRGAHYVADDTFLLQMQGTVEYLKSWQHNCTLQGRVCSLVVRTTVPGHPNCGDFKQPVKSTTMMESMIANMSNYREPNQKSFHWWDLKRQNILMLRLFFESGLDFQVMDAYDINILRPDHHRPPDCLHSCCPGKMDVYNQLLLHLMKIRMS